jgi:RNA polymerase sigma-70 factor (ECF subfamily)
VGLDSNDISRLYRCHARAMVAFAARRTFDPEAAVDLVAETFAIAYRDRRRCRAQDDQAAVAWLYGIVRHQLSHFYRHGDVERRAVQRLGVQRRALTDPEYERVEQLADLAGARARIAAELDRMPIDHAQVLQLRFVDELDYAQLAGRLDISQDAARARVSRALRSLAARLKPAAAEVGEDA